jgi:hypothetical protein
MHPPAVPSLLAGGFVLTQLYRLLLVPRQPDPKREAIPCRRVAPVTGAQERGGAGKPAC